MALGDDKIKDLFSSKLGGFEPEVPASVWGGIDQLLSQLPPPAKAPDASSSQATNTTASAAKTGGTALKTGLIAVGVAASVTVGVFFAYDSSELETTQITEEVIPQEIVDSSAEEQVIPETTKVLTQADFSGNVINTRKPAVITFAEIDYAEEVDASEEEASIEEVAKVEEKSEVLDVAEVEETEAEAPVPLPKFLKEDIDINLYASIGAMSSTVKENGSGLLFSRNDRSTEFIDALNKEGKETKLSHNLPIAVGLTVSKSLSPRFSIESGLVFTYLSSNITSGSAANIKEEQKFGYLGIPIYLNYNFLELHKAKFYISLGAMMQKDVYGKYTSRLNGGNDVLRLGIPADILYSEPIHLKKNISQSHWQFSSHFVVGASYPIYRRVYVYTTVGGVYYFDAGNEYRTIYSDKKFQLDLNLGLRLDF